MAENIQFTGQQVLFSRTNELVRVTPCHKNAVRFEAFPDCKIFDENYTLLPQQADCSFEEREYCVFLTVGRVRLQLEQNGKITVYKDGAVILEEQPDLAFHDGYRRYRRKDGSWSALLTFHANEGERFYGLGHDACGRFDLKGCAFDLRHVNAKTAIPFVYSSLGYGFLWNNPAVGSVELAENRTRWSVGATRKIDFVVIAGNPQEVCEALADLTGHAPVMPHWATGFWQSRLRYETQEDLLAVARRYKEENIPLSAIICDYFHWTEQGDYKFDPRYWPDVDAMTKELHDMGTKLIVSVWPTINGNSENYWTMRERNLLIRTSGGMNDVFSFYGPQAEIDVTNPAERKLSRSRGRRPLVRRSGAGDSPGAFRQPSVSYRARRRSRAAVSLLLRADGIRRLYEDGQSAGHPDPRRLSRRAEVRRVGVERRHPLHVRKPLAAGESRAEYGDVRYSVVEHGYRRLLGWRYRKRGLPRTDRALVPVRRILSGDARPRQPKPPRRKDARCERADRRPE